MNVNGEFCCVLVLKSQWSSELCQKSSALEKPLSTRNEMPTVFGFVGL